MHEDIYSISVLYTDVGQRLCDVLCTLTTLEYTYKSELYNNTI